MEREPHRLTDDELLRQTLDIYDELGQPGIVPDKIARLIASRWHGGQTSELYSFQSTGRIDLAELQGELLYEFAKQDRTPDETRELTALALYVVGSGEREAVEGWHDKTKWETTSSDLERTIAEDFYGVSTREIARRMERAADFGYDDEEFELTRRLGRIGMKWMWDEQTKVKFYKEGES